MNANQSNPADRRPTDPIFQGVDAALRRAATKAQERARQHPPKSISNLSQTQSVASPATPVQVK